LHQFFCYNRNRYGRYKVKRKSWNCQFFLHFAALSIGNQQTIGSNGKKTEQRINSFQQELNPIVFVY